MYTEEQRKKVHDDLDKKRALVAEEQAAEIKGLLALHPTTPVALTEREAALVAALVMVMSKTTVVVGQLLMDMAELAADMAALEGTLVVMVGLIKSENEDGA